MLHSFVLLTKEVSYFYRLLVTGYAQKILSTSKLH